MADTKTEEKDQKDQKQSKKDREDEREEQRIAQNLPEGAVPEKRPQATTHRVEHGQIHDRMVEEHGHALGEEPAMDQDAYDKAESEAQAKKAAKDSLPPERFYPGAHAVIVNPDGDGKEHDGRMVAVNAVHAFESKADELMAASGTPSARFATVDSYEVRTRDGRGEMLIVSADHLKRVPAQEFHKTVT